MSNACLTYNLLAKEPRLLGRKLETIDNRLMDITSRIVSILELVKGFPAMVKLGEESVVPLVPKTKSTKNTFNRTGNYLI